MKIAETLKEWAPSVTCVVVLVGFITYMVNRAATLDAHTERMRERTSEIADSLEAIGDELHKMAVDQAVMEARLNDLAGDIEEFKRRE